MFQGRYVYIPITIGLMLIFQFMSIYERHAGPGAATNVLSIAVVVAIVLSLLVLLGVAHFLFLALKSGPIKTRSGGELTGRDVLTLVVIFAALIAVNHWLRS